MGCKDIACELYKYIWYGILENDVKTSPKFYDVYSEIEDIIGKDVIIHHMPFDKVAIRKAYKSMICPTSILIGSTQLEYKEGLGVNLQIGRMDYHISQNILTLASFHHKTQPSFTR